MSVKSRLLQPRGKLPSVTTDHGGIRDDHDLRDCRCDPAQRASASSDVNSLLASTFSNLDKMKSATVDLKVQIEPRGAKAADEDVLGAELARAQHPFARKSGDLNGLRERLLDAMWDDVGVIRDAAGLQRGLTLAGGRVCGVDCGAQLLLA